jgi:hypothetical protein
MIRIESGTSLPATNGAPMSAAVVTKILTAIPWTDIFKHGPGLLDSARGLFNKSREPHAKGSLEDRIARLEKNEKEQARLIEHLVERQELLVSAVQVTGFRLKALFVFTLVAVAGLVTCIVILSSR